MSYSESIRPIFAIASIIMFLATACGTRSSNTGEVEKAGPPPKTITKKGESQIPTFPARQAESAEHKIKRSHPLSPDRPTDEISDSYDFSKIDWGRSITLDEMIAMAKKGEIQQIEWHVMPNIIRAQALDNRIFHIRNENKGIDIRNALTDAGVRMGKDGVTIRYVF